MQKEDGRQENQLGWYEDLPHNNLNFLDQNGLSYLQISVFPKILSTFFAHQFKQNVLHKIECYFEILTFIPNLGYLYLKLLTISPQNFDLLDSFLCSFQVKANILAIVPFRMLTILCQTFIYFEKLLIFFWKIPYRRFHIEISNFYSKISQCQLFNCGNFDFFIPLDEIFDLQC